MAYLLWHGALRLAVPNQDTFTQSCRQRSGDTVPARANGRPSRSCPTWPGNIRELENVISRALVLLAGDTIEPVDLLLPDLSGPSRPEPDIPADNSAVLRSYHESMDAHSRKIIENA
jgi:DNA-binding NtrC family response regulator